MRKKILLLGSGELGKELVIAMQRLGQYVIAVDNYKDAPAMQVAQDCEVINMLDGKALLVGTDSKNIELELNNLIKVSKEFKELKKNLNTFGRGDASKLIFKETLNFLKEKN